MADSGASGYYAYQGGQYNPVYFQTPSGNNSQPNYVTNSQIGYGGSGNTGANPNTQFFTQNSSGGYAPYSGSVYNGSSSSGYSLFSAGNATPATASATQSTTPTSTSTNPNSPGGPGNTVAGTPTTNNQTTPGMQQAGVVPGTNLLANQMQEITNQNINQLNNPSVPASGKATPVNQQAQSGEMLSNQTVDPNANQVISSIGNINASTANVATAANPTTGMQAATYNPNQLDPNVLAQTTQAVTAAMPQGALVSQQLQQLLTPDANGNLPSWVQPAVTAANQFLTGRGISNSTMAGQAITSAILTAAIPVAQANASAVLTAWQQNLTNEQQAAMQNGQSVVQGMLSNQGATNAAANFNATSQNQTNQFLGSLAATINQFNATQTNAIGQFNASQTQSAATNSAQLQSQLAQFNANMANQREQFNTQNAIIIQQSNAEYLRAVNTANTAVANQDNQLNAQNAMNLSDQAMANLQQQFNDEATMLYNSNMTQEEQNFALSYLSQQYGLQNQLNTNITDTQAAQAQSQQIGNFAGSLLNPIGNALGSGIGNLINGFGSTGQSIDTNPAGTVANDVANAAANGG